ncbi:MAG TPA: pirin family protein [Vicinamibacterales bacterium]
MSRRAESVSAEACVALGATGHALQSYPNRELSLGSLTVSRALPVKDKRLVGPWCFLDRFGPLSFTDGKPMDVAPHPHIGLQTVTWLFDGEVVHDDSLGSEAVLRPGGVNVMTAGSGITHAEQTPRDHTGRLNGVQLWVALTSAHRHRAAAFQHVKDVPGLPLPGGIAHVFAGSLGGATSSASHYSPIVGADLDLQPRATVDLPLDPSFEHAVLVIRGDCALEGERLDERMLYYLGIRRSEASFSSRDGGRLLLIGGPPFPETILMWWNFVARTPEEIADARAAWEAHRHFGDVVAYHGPRLSAPSLVRLARPDPLS